MKNKAITLILAAIVSIAVLVSCSQTAKEDTTSGATTEVEESVTDAVQPEVEEDAISGATSEGEESEGLHERTQKYADAITQYGGEMVQYNPVITEFSEENSSLLESLGLREEALSAFAASTTLMNVKAYGIVAAMPAEGQEDAVLQALQTFVENKQASFERYLEDQYEIACNARLSILEDGTVLMVMSEGQDEIFDAIATFILEDAEK